MTEAIATITGAALIAYALLRSSTAIVTAIKEVEPYASTPTVTRSYTSAINEGDEEFEMPEMPDTATPDTVTSQQATLAADMLLGGSL